MTKRIARNKILTSGALALAAVGVAGMFAFSQPAGAAPVATGDTKGVIAGSAPIDLDKVATKTGSVQSASVSYSAYVGYLSAGATARYCFHWSHANQGAVAVSAAARTYNVILTTVSTDLENRLNYGWTYCATINNSSALGTDVDLYAKSAL